MQKTIQHLKENLKSNLIAVAEYGKQEKQHIIILQKLDSSVLKNIKPLLQDYYKKTKKFPLLITKEELTDGLDVFPLEFLNIKLNHSVLYGENLFLSLSFDKKYIRRELEFEFRSKLINLRQGYLETASGKQLSVIVKKAIPTLLPILNGLLFLKDIDIPDSLDEMIVLLSKEYKVNTEILKKLQSSTEDLEGSIKELVIFLSTLGEILDEMRI